MKTKLHLVERFCDTQIFCKRIKRTAKAYEKSRDDKLFGQIDETLPDNTRRAVTVKLKAERSCKSGI